VALWRSLPRRRIACEAGSGGVALGGGVAWILGESATSRACSSSGAQPSAWVRTVQVVPVRNNDQGSNYARPDARRAMSLLASNVDLSPRRRMME
jgi:hypothetical protein